MKSISRFRPNMAVTESILGRSTVPLRKIKKKTKGRGHRILCLDGGGVKVRHYEITNLLIGLS